jgi:hypothetical protein
MVETNDKDAAEETPRQPCGRKDCQCWEADFFEPKVESPRVATVEALAAEAHPDELVEWHEKIDKGLSYHESFHAVAACALGCDVREIKCGEARGYCKHSPSSEVDEILILMAGPLGEAMVAHAWKVSHPLTYISKARAGTAPKDGCDCCRVANAFIKLGWDDEQIFRMWMLHWKYTQALLDNLTIRIAVANVAAALQRERLLTADRFNELVDVPALREAHVNLFK